MALIDAVKPRIGIFYSDENKDIEVQSMIDGAKQYFKNSGWEIDETDQVAIEAVILYCKMAQSTDPSQFTNHPVLLSFIAQGRANVPTVATPTAAPVGGSYTGAKTVTLECATSYTKIYYTKDGTVPTEESTLYSSSIVINDTTILKAIGIRYGYYDSEIMTEAYNIA